MKDLLQKHHISFQAALSGLVWAFTTQPNFKIHIFLSVAALSAAYNFHVTRMELVIIVFTIVLGMAVEMINTAIESITDLVTTEWKKEAKIAKDVSAGMMLLTAIAAVGVAVIVFWPYVFR